MGNGKAADVQSTKYDQRNTQAGTHRRQAADKVEVPTAKRGQSLPVSLLNFILSGIGLDAKLVIELGFFHHRGGDLGVVARSVSGKEGNGFVIF